MFNKWKPSKKSKEEFKEKMEAIEKFLDEHADVSASRSRDSFYFTVNGTQYRVSNHSIEASNAKAYDEFTGEQIREKYHGDCRGNGTRYIHASKTRLIEIYNAIKDGKQIDGHGCILA